MERVCFQLQVRRDQLEEYTARHAAVWPDMLEALHVTGWRNYSLFLREDGLVTMANAHLMAAMPNAFLLETNMTANPLKEGLFKEPLPIRSGYLDIPDKPGLGVELKDGLEEQYPPIPGPWNIPDPDMAR